MTEQEKKELLDELEKRMDEKYKGCLTREDVATTLKVPREKWFRDENGNGRYSLMADAFDSTIISWQVWETIRKLTCVVCGKQYVRQLANVENADEIAEKLADYEDLEEQGLLVRIPCKVGDTVWELCLCDDENYRILPMIVKTISEYGAIRQVKKDMTIWNIYAESDYTYMYKSFADFGKTVFSTKEEAEKKLEEMKNNGSKK